MLQINMMLLLSSVSLLINSLSALVCFPPETIYPPQNFGKGFTHNTVFENTETSLQAALAAVKNDPAKQLLVLQALADFYYESKRPNDEKKILLSWINLALTQPDYPLILVATQQLRLSNTYFVLEEYGNAKLVAKAALETFKFSCGELSPQVAVALNNLAWIEIKLKRYKPAEFYLMSALSIIRKEMGKSSLFYGIVAENLASLYERQGNHEKAMSFFRNSYKALKNQLSEDDPATIECLRRYKEAQRVVKAHRRENKNTNKSSRKLAGEKPASK